MPAPPSSPFFSYVLPLELLLFSVLPPSLPLPASPCSPSTCGNSSISIPYPFWLVQFPNNPPAAYCGYADLMLHCINGSVFIVLPGGENYYNVTAIDSSSQTFSVVDTAAVKDEDASGCPSPRHNITIDEANSSLRFTNEDTHLNFYYNCTTKIADGLKACGDDSGGRYSYVGTIGANGPADCDTVMEPVLQAAVQGDLSFFSVDIMGAVKQGFQVGWSTTDDESCRRCEGSDGNCGRDAKGEFVCFCHGEINGEDCRSEKNSTQHRGLVIGLSTGGGLSLAAVVSICFVLYARRRRTRTRSTLLDGKDSHYPSLKSDPEVGSSLRAPIFSYDELHVATNGFNASNVLGDGGFGTVYKGKLRDGRVVAVKRLYENNSRRVEQFTNEVSILSLLRHPNLVTLYGCTPHRTPALLLVYEFVPNGTVAEHLHGSLSSASPLPWDMRMRIAVETAEALSYLHSVEPPIVHRDVKTSNILLDGAFHVKVADFGLSRLFPLDATHVSTAPQGTPGYLDPEYHMCYQLTDKSDVYSFGVVLLELIASKPAVDITRQRNEINLATMAIGKMQRRELHDFVDARLGFASDSAVEWMITQVAEVAFRCLQAESEMRPGIRDVLDALKGIARRTKSDVSDKGGQALKSSPPLSPDTVTVRWGSIQTTPNTSG